MTKRTDIEPNGNGFRALSYTRRCGWIDWGHASPRNARALLANIIAEGRSSLELAEARVELVKRPAFLIQHSEAMGAFGFRAESSSYFAIVRGLSPQEKRSVALSVFLASSIKFEQMQSSPPFSLFIGSGFSAEDLTSNLVGFYAALYHIAGPQLRQICGEVSVKESYRIWDTYLPGGLEALKRRTATPILFPTKEDVHSPRDLAFPPQFTTIPVTPPGDKWVQMTATTDVSRLVKLRASINVSRDGQPGVTSGSVAVPGPRSRAR